MDNCSNERRLLRAAFHERCLPILAELPAERFTQKGWQYFDMIDRGW
jgi:hypothetical protein